MKNITHTEFFSLYHKKLHFLLKFLGVLLSCWSFSKAAILNEADPLSKYICSLQLQIQQNQGETSQGEITHEDQAKQLHTGTASMRPNEPHHFAPGEKLY